MVFKPAAILLFISALVFAGCAQDTGSEYNINADEFETQVIYGDDDRRDWFEADPAYRALAESTVGLFYSSDLQENNNSFTVRTSRPNWCSDEPFRNQGTSAFCSGFLVGPDLVVTAGHCIRSQSSCSRIKFAFGFALKSKNHDFRTLAKDDVYSCAELVTTKVENSGADYAVVRLDRPVTNQQPLKIRRSGTVTSGTDLVVIGHPAGLPSKVADGAQVRSVRSSYFVANLDTYGGNSGSAVFNTRTQEVEGILVRGDNDFIYSNGCQRSNVCANGGCRGEDVTRIDNVLNYVPALSGQPVPTPEEPTEPGSTSLFTSSESISIPDNSQRGLSSRIEVTEPAGGRSVLVHIDINHSYVGDLAIGLVSPSGQVINLRTRMGGSSRDLVGTFGSDLISEDNLERLSYESAGEWNLIIYDLAYMDSGTLNSWAIEFK